MYETALHEGHIVTSNPTATAVRALRTFENL